MEHRDVIARSHLPSREFLPYLVLAALISIAACSASDTDTTADDIVAVSQLMVTFDRVSGEGEPGELAALFAEDAVLMPPGEPAILGRSAIAEWHRERRRRFRIEETRESLEVDVAGELIVHRGKIDDTLIPRDGGEPLVVDRKYLMVLRRRPEGSLLIWREIQNDNGPR